MKPTWWPEDLLFQAPSFPKKTNEGTITYKITE